MSKAIPAITVLDEFGEEVRNRKEPTLPEVAPKPWSNFDLDLPLPFRKSVVLAKEEYEKLLKISTIFDGGNIRMYKYMETREMVAMTAIKVGHSADRMKDAKDVKIVNQEIIWLRQLRHPRLARCYGTYHNERKVVYFREYVPCRSVYDKAVREQIPSITCMKYMRQSCEALQYLHLRHLVHGSLTIASMLLTISDDVKLAGYGTAPDERHQWLNGFWAPAPEASNGTKPTSAADIWNVGFALITLFDSSWIKQRRVPPTDAVEALRNLPSERIKQLASACLAKDPLQRPTTDQILGTDVMQQNAYECDSIGILGFRKTKTNATCASAENTMHRRRYSNFDVTAEQRNYKQSDSSTKGDVTQRPLYRTNGLTYFVAFMGSRLLLFLWMMLKWSLMIFVVGLALWCMASFIFLSIFVIYRAIRILCQCELNEGSFHVDLPEEDLVVCGVKIKDGAKSERIKAERARAADEKRKSCAEEFDHKIKGSIQRAIAEIA